jgi:hypothetical protein
MFPVKFITMLLLPLFLLLMSELMVLLSPHYSFLPSAFVQTKDTELMDSTADCFRKMY